MSGSPPLIFDRPLLRRRRDRAAATQARTAPVLEALAERLLDRLDDTTRRFHRALEIGGRGHVAPALRARGIGFVASMDLSPRLAGLAGGDHPLTGDEEWLPFGFVALATFAARVAVLAQLRRTL